MGDAVRFEHLRDAYARLVEAGELDENEFEGQVLEPARRITHAKWWLNNRDAGDDLVELLQDPGSIGDDVVNENPY